MNYSKSLLIRDYRLLQCDLAEDLQAKLIF